MYHLHLKKDYYLIYIVIIVLRQEENAEAENLYFEDSYKKKAGGTNIQMRFASAGTFNHPTPFAPD